MNSAAFLQTSTTWPPSAPPPTTASTARRPQRGCADARLVRRLGARRRLGTPGGRNRNMFGLLSEPGRPMCSSDRVWTASPRQAVRRSVWRRRRRARGPAAGRRIAQGGGAPRISLARRELVQRGRRPLPPSVMGSSVFADVAPGRLWTPGPGAITVREALDGIGYPGASRGPRRPATPRSTSSRAGPLSAGHLHRSGRQQLVPPRSWISKMLGEQSHTGATAMAAGTTP